MARYNYLGCYMSYCRDKDIDEKINTVQRIFQKTDRHQYKIEYYRYRFNDI